MLAVLLRPGELDGSPHPMSRHEGEELLYVVKGHVTLQLADRKELLGPGDCAHFNSAVPHRLTPVGNDEAEVLIIIALDRSRD
jgi:quercetin dioxygenase-like cupin family protein